MYIAYTMSLKLW